MGKFNSAGDQNFQRLNFINKLNFINPLHSTVPSEETLCLNLANRTSSFYNLLIIIMNDDTFGIV